MEKKTGDAAIVSITVMSNPTSLGRVSIIINDGGRRSMSKDKAYTLVIDLVPSLAAKATMLLRDDKNFIVSVPEGKIIELAADGDRRRDETQRRLREDMSITSPSVFARAMEERLAGPAVEKGMVRSFRRQDELLKKQARAPGDDREDQIRKR